MKSANALLYLSPQYENPQYENMQLMVSAPPINEEEEYNNDDNDHSQGGFAVDDQISFRGGHSQF